MLRVNRSLEKELDEELGVGFYEFVLKALSSFSENQQSCDIEDAIEKMEQMGRKKYTTSSIEVQGEVKRMYDYLMKFPMLSKELCLNLLMKFSDMFGSKEYHSVEKAMEAEALGIYLLPGQTLVDSYTKYFPVA